MVILVWYSHLECAMDTQPSLNGSTIRLAYRDKVSVAAMREILTSSLEAKLTGPFSYRQSRRAA